MQQAKLSRPACCHRRFAVVSKGNEDEDCANRSFECTIARQDPWKVLAMPYDSIRHHVPRGPSALVQHFVALHIWDAQAIQQRFGVPASVVLAQSGYESGWGTKVIQNAYFASALKATHLMATQRHSLPMSTTSRANGMICLINSAHIEIITKRPWITPKYYADSMLPHSPIKITA